jgi:hypothetical protein
MGEVPGFFFSTAGAIRPFSRNPRAPWLRTLVSVVKQRQKRTCLHFCDKNRQFVSRRVIREFFSFTARILAINVCS